jgi:hypothetical protein
MTTDEFRRRPMQTRTWTLCDECKQLREDPDVQERESYWPTFTCVCCLACFKELVSAGQAVVVC